MKKLLNSIGIVAAPGCSCNARAVIMDQEGPDWCTANLDLIVGWLKEEAQKRGLPFLDLGARLLVLRAIRKARALASNNPAE